MTDRQRIHLFAVLWPDACATQGWSAEDRDRRLEVVSQALGREVRSTSEINSTTDYDLVKSRLLLLRESLTGAVEDGHPAVGEARRLRWKIRKSAPHAYIQAILRDRFQGADLDDLDLTELRQLLYTLAARAVRHRRREPAKPSPVQQCDPELCPF